MRASMATLAFTLAAIPFTPVLAGLQPFDNRQPSLVINELMTSAGIFPAPSGPGAALGDTLGFIYDFAGSFAPSRAFVANGQTLPINQNTALFSLLGVMYGGNGVNNFALPNLQGVAIVGAGAGPQLTPRAPGDTVGAAAVTLTPSQLPAPHQPSAAVPYETTQPSLALTPLVAVGDAGMAGSAAPIGQIAWFAGNFVPAGWARADGQVLSIAANPALFDIIGQTYGGDGVTTFALPDLEGRIAIGKDGANPLGSAKGAETYAVNQSQLPAPGQQPLDNDQPSLAVGYIIAVAGIFPAPDSDPFDPNIPVLGQIAAFAGADPPRGWALADGQLLSISQNQALFALFGTTYGGNGVTTFALPNLDGRTIIGAGGDFAVGETLGADMIFLSADNLPPVTGVPEPSTWAMFVVGFAGIGLAFRMRRQHRPA